MPGAHRRVFESRACRITILDDRKIASARAANTEWWFAISYVRRSLKVSGMLRQVEITDEMPPRAPWKDGARADSRCARLPDRLLAQGPT
jgi:hypothetical protein